MASTGRKEYTIVINGITESVENMTTLENAVTRVDGGMKEVSKSTAAASKTAKDHKSALTEEEKAAKKLEETQRKISQANSEANRKQIEANELLRKAQREASLLAKEENAVAGSLDQMRARLSRLNVEWKGVEVGSERFNELNAEILQLNENIKRAEEGAGDFRRSVGNYEKATSGLAKLSDGIAGVTKTTQGMAQGLLGAMSVLTLFGGQSEEDAERVQKLQKVIVLLSLAQRVNTNLLKQNITQKKTSSALDAVQTTRIKAKTAAEAASTKTTAAATVVQRIFNAVASANPYVLLALALVAVVGALLSFSGGTKSAAKEQSRLNELQQDYIDLLQRERDDIRETANRRIAALEIEKKLLEARDASAAEIGKIDQQILAVRTAATNKIIKDQAEEIAQLGKLEKEYAFMTAQLEKLYETKKKGYKQAWFNLPDGTRVKMQVQDAIDKMQEVADQTKVRIGFIYDIQQEQADNEAEQEILDREQRKRAEELAKQIAKTETDAVRAAQDARLKLIRNTDEQARKTLIAGHNRQVEDLKKRLDTEKNLTAKTRAAINDQIKSLEVQLTVDLENLQKERAARELALRRELEDSRLALMVSGFDRELAEINLQYDRQIEAYKKRLEEDKTLTEQQQADITELILNAQDARGKALSATLAEQSRQRADLALTAIEDSLQAQQNKIDEMVARNKDGLQLIDVDATRRNYAAANSALADYVLDLQEYLRTLESSHKETLRTMKEGTVEFEAEQLEYARTVEEVTKRIKDALKEQEDNVRASARAQSEAMEDLFGKITELANDAANWIGMAISTINLALSSQLDDLNEQLDILNERYEEAQKQHQAAADRVSELEKQMQSATGGTAEALKEQLREAMHARNEAARQEQQLAKQKERAEADIAKKEKQMKRADLVSNIAVGLANVAQAVTKALTLGPILGPIFAGILSAIGAVQVGIMTRQLAKLERGGEIKGPRHSENGVEIAIQGRPSYEAEGGEFMVNRASYGANRALVQYINSTPKAVTLSDLTGVVPGGGTPIGGNFAINTNEDRILEAINSINIRPIVAVTDINEVSGSMVEVRDLAGVQ